MSEYAYRLLYMTHIYMIHQVTPLASMHIEISSSLFGSYAYTNQELDLLALFATAIKIVYLEGKLDLLPALYGFLEPCRIQAEKPLHETTIRNEIAYYQEIGHILCYRSKYHSSHMNTNLFIDQSIVSIYIFMYIYKT